VAPRLLAHLSMAEEPEEDERVSKRVVYEHTTSSRNNAPALIVGALLALALIVYIVMHLH
jgi:hypothetical protein